MKPAAAALLIVATMLLAGCLERTGGGDADDAGALWQLAGQFGGDAEVLTPSDDPLEVRFAPGGFKLVSGLDVTEDEVWVCDRDISRIQVFDFAGRLVRTIGSGIVAESVLPTDEEHFVEAANFSRSNGVSWEAVNGAPWIASYRTHFRAVDIVVRPDGYWIADQVRTSGLRDPLRTPGVFFVPWDGEVVQLEANYLVWPSHIAATAELVCAADYRANNLALCNIARDPPDVSYLHRGGNYNNIMALEVTFADNPQYLAQHFRFASGSSAPGATYLPGGMAFAFGKLAVCDTLNRRVQVYEARTDNSNWGKVIREIQAKDQDDNVRFEVPLDLEIAGDGTVLICDNGAAEIVVLDESFARLGSFGGDVLIEPYALALSPDGRHCFVTDRRTNMVYHYAQGE